MNPEDAIDFSREAIKTCMLVGGPILVTSLLVGLIIGIIQTMTQVQDQTVSFVPKILVLIALIGICLPWLTERMTDFARLSFEKPMTQWSNIAPPSLFATDKGPETDSIQATNGVSVSDQDNSIFSLISQFQKFEQAANQKEESDSLESTPAASNNPFSLPHYRVSKVPRTKKGG